MSNIQTGTAKKAVKKNPLKRSKNILLFNRRGETRIYLILSFLIPFLTIWFFFARSDVAPFGDKQILVTDLWHQYYPFFRVEHEKLQNLSSFLYTWEAGLGTNFISLMSYYAASPLNLLAVFFPIEYSREALTLFLTIKIGCAGLFFGVFLKNTFNKNDISITAFAICFALCDFIMGYYWNIIWMDTVALLPLVVLGTVKLYKEGKYKLYVISLALSLITSFYIGLFICVFTVMVFAALVIAEWGGFKNAFKRLGQIAGATAIGIGLGAFILIPAYLALKLTVSVNNSFPTDVVYYETWFKMISAATGFHEPTAKEGLPNLYCGMFSLILLGAYIIEGKIKIREKVITAAYLVFIIVSCNMNVLNYMWHGFHFTNMLPYRFSFLFSFIILAAGYRVFSVMTEERNLKGLISAGAMIAAGAAVILISWNEQPHKALIECIIACGVYILAIIIFKLKLINKTVLNYVVFAACFAEMGMNCHIGVNTVTVTDYVSYPRKNVHISTLVGDVESNDKDFFRLETTTNYSINDPALYGYRGVSQFSSTANVNVTYLMHDWGIEAQDIGNRYYYNQNTAIVNMLLNLKYILSVDNYSGDLTYLDPTSEFDGVNLYTNNHYLPIGFAAGSSVTDYEGGSSNMFENQNEIFRLLTGIDEDVLKRLEIKDVGHKGLNVIKTGYGSYNFQYNNPDDSDDVYLKYNYNVTDDGPVYCTFNFPDVSSIRIKSGDSILHTRNADSYVDIFAAGDFKAGDVVTLQADVKKDKANGNAVVYAYQIDRDVFERGYEKLKAGGLDVSDFDDTHISGNIKVEKDGVIYTSIPYDGGWKAYVDGVKTETLSVKKAFTCIPVTAGEHTIELKYTPPGFVLGIITTVSSLAVFILLWIYGPKVTAMAEARAAERKKKKAADDSADDKPDTPDEADKADTVDTTDSSDKTDTSDDTSDKPEAPEEAAEDK